MSKTMKFPVTVHLGKVEYSPGRDVPIGGKTGLSDDEARNILENFGIWAPGEGVSETDERFAAFKADLEAAQREAQRVPALEAEIVQLKNDVAKRHSPEDFEAEKKKVEELEGDTDALSKEVEKLTADIKLKDERIKKLEADLDAVEKKAAPK